MNGTRFTRLTVLDDTLRKQGQVICRCVCDCGKEVLAYKSNLTRGATKSCGCLKLETAGQHVKKHGMSNSDEYKIWAGMNKRCYNPKHRDFHIWGGKGIKVCDEWRHDFAKFYADMGPRPSKRHSIDRIDNAKDYCKDNCRWQTAKQQTLNTNRVYKILYKGEVMSLRSVAEAANVKYGWLYHNHIRKGHSLCFLIPG